MRNSKMRELQASLLAVSALCALGSAEAHHSAAMFDMTKTVSVTGTVKEWQFMNPHSWLQVMTVDADGKEVQWSFEGPSPAGGGVSVNAMMSKDTFKPGDKITVESHPMKDGRHAGLLGPVTFADGHKWAPRPPPGVLPPGAPPPGGALPPGAPPPGALPPGAPPPPGAPSPP